MRIVCIITIYLVSIFFSIICTGVLLCAQHDRSDKSADTKSHIKTREYDQSASDLTTNIYQPVARSPGINFVWITLSIASVCCVVMLCFNIRRKLIKKLGCKRTRKRDLGSTPDSQSVQSPYPKSRVLADEKRGLQDNNHQQAYAHPAPKTPHSPSAHEACPRSISQFSCVRSDESTERQFSQPDSLCPCATSDYSTGESGYETIERPMAASTSAETVNDIRQASFPRKWLQRRTKLDSWVTRTTRHFRKVHHSFRENIDLTAIPSAKTQHLSIESDHFGEGLAFFNRGWKDAETDENDRLQVNLSNFHADYSAAPFEHICDGRALVASSKMEKLPVSERTNLSSEEDSISLTSSNDFIDPIYSKIHGSVENFSKDQLDDLFDNESPEENDITWCEDCCGRHFNGSQPSSHTSAHLSTHIYYELYKPLVNQHSDGHLIQPSCDSSVWSIRPVNLSTQEHLHPHHRPRISNSRSRPQSDTPPQLPARLYGQSTVNLVDRLRNLLQPVSPKHSSPTRVLPVFNTQKAATMSDIVDSPRSGGLPLSRHSLTNILIKYTDDRSLPTIFNASCVAPMRSCLEYTEAVQTENIKSDNDDFRSDVGCHCEYGTRPANLAGKLGTHQIVKDSSVSEKPNCAPFLKRTRATSSTSSTYAIEIAHPNQIEPMNSDADPMASIRHIDSELDLSAAARRQYSEGQQTSQLGPSRHIYLPSITLSSSRRPDATERKPYNHQPVTPRRAWPSVEKIAVSNTFPHPMTMSPLMERSMEDEETRHLLRVQ